MLDATARLLQFRGYHGTALNDILLESNAPRGSLYFHFPGGKGQIALEATKTAVDQVTRERVATLAAAKTPADAIRTIAGDIADVLRETEFASGCPISPLVLDGMSEFPELAALCKQTFEEWIGLLRDDFVKARIPEKQARALALLALSTFQGSVLIARTYRDIAPVIAAGDQLADIVEAALPQPTTALKSRSTSPGKRKR